MLGHELLNSIHSCKGPGNVAAMLRHAERFPILDPNDPTLAELTPDGMEAASLMGTRIEGFQELRLFHSPVKRCRQTAEFLAQGAKSRGIKVELCGESLDLGVFYILDLIETGKMHVKHGDDFIRLWFSGLVREGIVQEPELIAQRKVAHIAKHLAETTTAGRRLDLHISHDWNIIILREMLLGITHEQSGWLNFLDGITFVPFEDKGLTASYRAKSVSSMLPWTTFKRRPRLTEEVL